MNILLISEDAVQGAKKALREIEAFQMREFQARCDAEGCGAVMCAMIYGQGSDEESK